MSADKAASTLDDDLERLAGMLVTARPGTWVGHVSSTADADMYLMSQVSRCVASVWPLCGRGVATVWPRCGGGVAAVSPRCGGCVAAVWPRYRHGVAVLSQMRLWGRLWGRVCNVEAGAPR
eukprot:351656-Chlamydomonas_euryale.AAC.1